MIDLEKLRESVRAHQKHELDIEFCPDYILRLADYIAQLEKENTALQRDAGRWCAVTRNMKLNDVAVIVYDNYGDYRVVIEDEADEAIDTAMEANNG